MSGAPQASWTPGAQRHRRRGVIATWAAALAGAAGLCALLVVITQVAGAASSLLVPVALALVPLLIVLVSVRWIDRWEPEPAGMLLVAFLWGAGVATIVALVINTSTAALVAGATGEPDAGELAAAVVTAPIIEETMKGLGVLLLFLAQRRHFNGAVDGIVYAAVVAAGFAFAENILYFVQGSDALVETFVVRGLISPFAHVTFTACTGLAIGASARMRSPRAWLWTAPAGLVAAIALHAFWNGVLSVAPGLYLLVEVPFFLACIGLVVWLRWSERMTMRARLQDYQRAGWLAPEEVTMVTTGSGRSAAMRWARDRGPAASAAMREFIGAATSLAQLRQQAVDGHAGEDFTDSERELIDAVTRSRAAFLGRRS